MKIFGWILIVIGALNIVVLVPAINSGAERAEQMTSTLGIALGMLVLGLYLLSRAKAKLEEDAKKDKWSK